MTEDNRRLNMADELAAARSSLAAAEALAGLTLNADSVSRSYYAAFHALRALLLSEGQESRTHAGAIHLFNVHFVRKGTFPSSHNRLLGGMQRSRELADYSAGVRFSEEDARAQLEDARRFVADVLAHLAAGGWIDGAGAGPAGR